MKTETQPLTDEEFVTQLQQKTLAASEFGHIAHLRLAYILLTLYELDEARKRVCRTIRDYAEYLGAKDKFNYTLTCFIVTLMHKVLKSSDISSWDEFIIHNQGLVSYCKNIVSEYYSDDLLNSKIAKQQYVEPDLQAM